eukprot:gb/GFBE01010336.1/.p1 GENE.gb/GFBE01010336.1/~~gb/GFBE01010336.1/.p1  ORF type:complete len:536 (+),score=126.03 gb/GFBE01010336.1/:1-1608(+)
MATGTVMNEEREEELPMLQSQQAQAVPGRIGLLAAAGLVAAGLIAVAWSATSPKQLAKEVRRDEEIQLNSMKPHMSALESFVADGHAPASESGMSANMESLEDFVNKGKAYLTGQEALGDPRCMETCPAEVTNRRLDDSMSKLDAFISKGKQSKANKTQSTEEAMAAMLAGSFDQVHQGETKYQGLKEYLAPVDGESQESKDAKAKVAECVNHCPSQGFLAQVHWGSCEADCLRKTPIPGVDIPTEKSPLENCIDTKCQTSGPLWRLSYAACTKDCKHSTKDDEAAYVAKWKGPTALDMQEDEREDAETKVLAVLKKRIVVKSRPTDHPFAQVLQLYKSSLEKALATVVASDQLTTETILRPKSDLGTEGHPEGLMMSDPGNDLEAVLDLTDAPSSVIAKLSDPETMKQIDLEVATAIQKNPITDGTCDLHPAEISETTTATIEGNYASQGWNTVCRRDEDDTTMGDHNRVKVTYDKTLRACSLMCEEQGNSCYGFEYRAHENRCEIWTHPICHTEQTQIESTFVDFRCFKKCKA